MNVERVDLVSFAFLKDHVDVRKRIGKSEANMETGE